MKFHLYGHEDEETIYNINVKSNFDFTTPTERIDNYELEEQGAHLIGFYGAIRSSGIGFRKLGFVFC